MTQRNSGYGRIQGEAYFTPSWVVDCLLNIEREKARIGDFRSDGVYDPCCGDGRIVKALRGQDIYAGGQDINAHGFAPAGINFLSMASLPDGYSHIITNPPYGGGGKLAVEFIEHAIRLVEPKHGLVAFLLRSDFDSAKTRAHLFRDNAHFWGEVRLLKRIQWTNIVHTAGSSQNHCWFIWDTKIRYGDEHQPSKMYIHPEQLEKAA